MKRKRPKRKKKGPSSATNSVNKSMVMIQGRSGNGKSSLVHQFYQQLIHKGTNTNGTTGTTTTTTPSSLFPSCFSSCCCYKPYFVTGKFNEPQHHDQRNNDPLSAIVDAFPGFIQQILHPDTPQEERQRIRHSILTHVIKDHRHYRLWNDIFYFLSSIGCHQATAGRIYSTSWSCE